MRDAGALRWVTRGADASRGSSRDDVPSDWTGVGTGTQRCLGTVTTGGLHPAFLTPIFSDKLTSPGSNWLVSKHNGSKRTFV